MISSSQYPSPPLSATSPHKSPIHQTSAVSNQTSRHRRNSSLTERFPGDISHRPLSQLSREKALADKSHHATKKHHIRPDTVDLLDSTSASGSYHHGGPYDATLFARNNSYNSSPVAAVSSTTAAALSATSPERIADSLSQHRPLDGVAAYPPGTEDRNGHTYHYEEGENMMVELSPGGGAYKRIPGVEYHKDDIKGKGEPSYSLEKALRDHTRERSGSGAEKTRNLAGETGWEMTDRPRRGSANPFLADGEDEKDGKGVGRSDSLSKRLSGGLKKRIGSIKRRSRHEE